MNQDSGVNAFRVKTVGSSVAPFSGGPHAMAQLAQWLIRHCPHIEMKLKRNSFRTVLKHL